MSRSMSCCKRNPDRKEPSNYRASILASEREASQFQFWAVRQTKVSCSEKTRAEQPYHKSAASALARRTIKAKRTKLGARVSRLQPGRCKDPRSLCWGRRLVLR